MKMNKEVRGMRENVKKMEIGQQWRNLRPTTFWGQKGAMQ
jgi:hypothetical protein